jgi:hypothetical protein
MTQSTITLNIPYLYHTTLVYNKKSKEEFLEYLDEIPNYKLPKFGEFPTALNIGKYFTTSPLCDYNSSWTDADYVFLRYKVKKPLHLSIYKDDFMPYPHPPECDDVSECEHPTILDKRGYCDLFSPETDGYISTEDHVEIYLKNAIDFVEEDYEIIPFTESEDDACRTCKCHELYTPL